MIILDTTILLLFLDKATPPPMPISFPHERVAFLIQTLEEKNIKIIIPTPVISEILFLSGPAGSSYLTILNKSNVFKIAAFDLLAATELAIFSREAIRPAKKMRPSTQSWAKVKYDRQIIAIGKTLGVTTIYTDDKDLKAFAKTQSINPIGLAELPIPPEAMQQKMY